MDTHQADAAEVERGREGGQVVAVAHQVPLEPFK
jgi:hypothetical protein